MTNSDRARALLIAEGWSPEEAEKVIECLRDVLDGSPKVKNASPTIVTPPEGGALEV